MRPPDESELPKQGAQEPEALPVENTPAPSGQEDADLLQTCPWCDYRLAGLPVEHTCPECGRPFDRRWKVFDCGRRIWETPSSRAQEIMESLSFFALWWLPVLSGPHIFQSGWLCSGVWIFYLLLLASPQTLLRKWVLGWPYFVAVGPAALCIGDRRRKRLDSYAWDTVGEVDFRADKGMILELNGQRVRFVQWARRSATALECEVAMRNEIKAPIGERLSR